MKIYSIIITLLFLVVMTSILFPSIFSKERDWVLSGSFGDRYLRDEYTVDSVYDSDRFSYIKYVLSEYCKAKFLNDFNLHTAEETEVELRGRVRINDIYLENDHQYLYLRNGVYGYRILDLSGDTLIEWTLYDD